ncbi:Uncharacterized protein BM_BM17876 [Brugia malayi]|uniref:Uncharacterized protein n=1 Tax=Brugia malayi TaxID=6279 RepID=A0A4E9ENX6_BRUMA|nr:Uncharacterized protein BM_BM17876 [Brugia malayi]VIO85867.1 Uncharacterized protein BM_BM17876 [Brugia malayi]
MALSHCKNFENFLSNHMLIRDNSDSAKAKNDGNAG